MLTVICHIRNLVVTISVYSPATIRVVEYPRKIVERYRVALVILDTRYNVEVVASHSAENSTHLKSLITTSQSGCSHKCR